jgi:hypothetical protein
MRTLGAGLCALSTAGFLWAGAAAGDTAAQGFPYIWTQYGLVSELVV